MQLMKKLVRSASGNCAWSHTTLKFAKWGEPRRDFAADVVRRAEAMSTTPTSGTSATSAATSEDAVRNEPSQRESVLTRAARDG